MQQEIALITGGTSGIGLSVAKELLKRKVFVIISSEKKSCPDDIKHKLGSKGYEYYKCDISKSSDITKLKKHIQKKHGRLDYLHANAGIIPKPCGISDITERSIEKVLQTNLAGTFWTMRIIGELIRSTSTKGSIVATTSVDGVIGEPYAVMYSASKAGIISLTKSFAREYKDPLVRVNAVAPGLIDTPLTTSSGEDPSWTTDISIIKRMGKAEEVANTVSFLLSTESSFTTGQVLVVDGGFILK